MTVQCTAVFISSLNDIVLYYKLYRGLDIFVLPFLGKVSPHFEYSFAIVINNALLQISTLDLNPLFLCFLHAVLPIGVTVLFHSLCGVLALPQFSTPITLLENLVGGLRLLCFSMFTRHSNGSMCKTFQIIFRYDEWWKLSFCKCAEIFHYFGLFSSLKVKLLFC